jgi:hypothetical protein
MQRGPKVRRAFVIVDNDGDDAPVTPMPEHCVVWPCCKEKRPLENREGFMCCPICGGSYGAADNPAAEQQQPTMKCPKCPAEYPDFDGFGVLHCTACGYCKHPSITDGVCGLCGQSPKAPPCPCCFGTGQELVIRDKTYTRASCSKCNGTGQQA